MRIGKSDRRITIERYTTTTNVYGERRLDYTTLMTVWAELMKTGEGMTERISTNQDMPIQRVRFKIRSSSDSRGSGLTSTEAAALRVCLTRTARCHEAF